VRYTITGEELHVFIRQSHTRSRNGGIRFALPRCWRICRALPTRYLDKTTYCKPSNRVFLAMAKKFPIALSRAYRHTRQALSIRKMGKR